MSPAKSIRTTCCIAGGGPAGMMLGFLLARAGVEVIVLEKHADFLRDFRGDTIHPSTLEVIHELGLLEDFLKLPHQKVSEAGGQIGDEAVTLADFTHLPTKCKFVAFMPQWDFLNFLVEQGARYPTFKLMMQAEVTNLINEGGSIAGVRARTPGGEVEVHADLVVGCDGRHSVVREQAGLQIIDLGAPMDVLWFRLSRRASDTGQIFGRIVSGRIMVMLNRGDYWQCGFIIRKGGSDEVKQKGLEQFRQEIVAMVPYMKDRVSELKDWEEIRLLTVAVDRLRKWYRPGLLCIGDAAHAMSPMGGVGINLAIQDAVAAANLLAERLSRGTASLADLERVQLRREFPTRVTQGLQVFMQKQVIGRVLGSQEQLSPPLFIKLFQRWPFLRRIPARLIGIGFRPEHVKTRDAFGNSPAPDASVARA